MSCLLQVQIKSKIKRNGGVEATSFAILTTKEYNAIKNYLENIDISFCNEKIKNIHEVFDSRKEFKLSFIKSIEEKSTEDVFSIVYEFGNPIDSDNQSLAYYMVLSGHFFNVEQILKLDNSINRMGNSLAHSMAIKGYNFTTDELISLNNPSNSSGNTVAHMMIGNDKNNLVHFSFEDIMLLGNPSNTQGSTLAHGMASFGHKFSINELLQINDKRDIYGNTPSHYMVQTSPFTFFSIDELITLRNPVNNDGMSLSDLMEMNDHVFTEQEKERLRNIP